MKKVLIADTGHIGSELFLQTMKEKYGDDIVLVTLDEAKEQGLKENDFANIPVLEITASPEYVGEYKTGKQNRKERRAKERKLKKNR